MKNYFNFKLLIASLLLLFTTSAQAFISCSVSSSGFIAAYVPSHAGTMILQNSFTVTCVRALVVDPNSVTYSVKIDNGGNAQGQANRANFGGNLISYDNYIDSGCTTQWKNGTSLPTGGGSMNLTGTTSTSVTTTYWSCIPAGQLGLAAGTYTDNVNMTLISTPLTQTTNSRFPVTIYSPASCTVTTLPGNLNFGNYTALIAGTTLGSVSFGSTCTNTLPYTITLDSYVGVLNGLQYSLSLNTANTGGTNTINATGIGSEKTYYINGVMVGGQAGTCASSSCVGSQLHTLTITY